MLFIFIRELMSRSDRFWTQICLFAAIDFGTYTLPDPRLPSLILAQGLRSRTTRVSEQVRAIVGAGDPKLRIADLVLRPYGRVGSCT